MKTAVKTEAMGVVKRQIECQAHHLWKNTATLEVLFELKDDCPRTHGETCRDGICMHELI